MKTLRKLAARLHSLLPVPALPHRAFRTVCGLAVVAAAGLSVPSAFAQSAGVPVGRIEGDDISVRGEVQVAQENGRTYTSLESGSQVTVRSGRARIELAGGGEIGICGPARFSLLRAGTSLTLALDYGRVRARMSNPADLRIYTPQISASPIAGADRTDDINVGLEENGKMCVRAASGALRLVPQFGGESMVVPQGMEATLEDGRLAGLAETTKACGCDALETKHEPATPPAVAVSRITLSPDTPQGAAHPEQDSAKKAPQAPPPSAPGEQPIWKVYMSPLTFNAAAPGPTATPAKGATMPPPSPETALLFREVYVEPTIVWRGEVEAPAAASAKSAPAAANSAAPPAKKPSFGARVAGFFRRLFGGKPKTEQQSALKEALP
ncbi:MAG TPA: hypothetical protein VJX29_15260, partial [Candidatus Acidoferrales bacterium]|nr:hypothetical protein [Candidatus Acidoferrales bacterium]